MKSVLFMLSTVAMLCSCGNSDDGNMLTARRIFEAFNAHDWDQMASYYDERAVFIDPSFAGPVNNLDKVISHHRSMHEMFPDIHDDIKSIYTSGDHVIVEFVASGTATNGEKFELPICTVLTFKGGKVVRDATYYDNN